MRKFLFTKEEINELASVVGDTEASNLTFLFFNKVRKHLSSVDVADLYDEEYFKKIENHPIYKDINGFKVNIYQAASFDYLVTRRNNEKEQTILDIGCGTGSFACAMASIGYIVKGIDFSIEALDIAEKKITKDINLNIRFTNENIEKISTSKKYDFIVMNDLTEHLSDSELEIIFDKVKSLCHEKTEILIHTPNGLALCNDTDRSFKRSLYEFYLLLRGKDNFVRTLEQVYYDQVHINIKSYRQINDFLKKQDFVSKVIYDDNGPYFSFLDDILSSNMLVVAKITS